MDELEQQAAIDRAWGDFADTMERQGFDGHDGEDAMRIALQPLFDRINRDQAVINSFISAVANAQVQAMQVQQQSAGGAGVQAVWASEHGVMVLKEDGTVEKLSPSIEVGGGKKCLMPR